MTAQLTEPATTEPWMPANPWACPDGELVLPYNATREQWLEARKQSIGASDIAAVFGLAKWDGADPYSVWAEKSGLAPSKTQTRAMNRGLIMEKSVVDLWLAEDVDFPIVVRRKGLMRSKAHPRIAASLDFLSVCPLGRCCVEVKTQNDTSEWDDEEVPLEYQFQGQAQLLVTGRDHVHFIGMGHRFEIAHRVMHRDEALIEMMVARLESWWDLYMVTGTAPTPTAKSLDTINARYRDPADGEVADLPEHLWSAPARDKELAERIKALETERGDLAAQVREVVGNATVVAIDGDPVGTWKPTKKLVGADQKFIKANRDLVAPFMESVPALNVEALAAAHPELIEAGTLRRQRSFKWTV